MDTRDARGGWNYKVGVGCFERDGVGSRDMPGIGSEALLVGRGGKWGHVVRVVLGREGRRKKWGLLHLYINTVCLSI